MVLHVTKSFKLDLMLSEAECPVSKVSQQMILARLESTWSQICCNLRHKMLPSISVAFVAVQQNFTHCREKNTQSRTGQTSLHTCPANPQVIHSAIFRQTQRAHFFAAVYAFAQEGAGLFARSLLCAGLGRGCVPFCSQNVIGCLNVGAFPFLTHKGGLEGITRFTCLWDAHTLLIAGP